MDRRLTGSRKLIVTTPRAATTRRVPNSLQKYRGAIWAMLSSTLSRLLAATKILCSKPITAPVQTP